MKKFRFGKNGAKLLGGAILLYVCLFALTAALTQKITYSYTKILIFAALLLAANAAVYSSKKRYAAAIGLVLAAWSTYLFIPWSGNEVFLPKGTAAFLAWITGTALASLLAASVWPGKRTRAAVLLLLVGGLQLSLLFAWGYFLTTGSAVHAETILACMQTNGAEAKEYISDYLTGGVWLALAGYIVYLAAVWKAAESLTVRKGSRWMTVCIAVLFAANLGLAVKSMRNMFTEPVYQVQTYMEQYCVFEENRERRKEGIQKLAVAKNENMNGVYVLVIGESQNKDHMSAYGYERDTTPWLRHMKDTGKILLFDRAYSAHTHTTLVLTYALTAKNQYNKVPLEKAVSLLEAAEAAGFETVWLSNQVQYGAWDTPISVIAAEANQQKWLNRNVGEVLDTNVYDEELVIISAIRRIC